MDKYDHSLFFVDAVSREKALFAKDELRHALAALRLDIHGTLKATDGKGNIYDCTMLPESPASGEARVIAAVKSARPSPDIHVYIGLPDRDAFEKAMADLAAMGAARIIPLICSYCQNKWWEDWDKHAGRLRRKMIAGIKQSLNPWLPELARPLPFGRSEAALRAYHAHGCLVADAGGIPVRGALNALHAGSPAACVIGPPGGFSPEESDRLKAGGCVFVNIAPYRLRTELAAVVLCAAMVQAFSSCESCTT